MIRFICEILFLVLAYIISWPVYIVERIVRISNPRKAADISHWWVQFFTRIIFALTGSKAKVDGLENIPDDTAVLYVANHCSYLDIVLVVLYLPRATGFVAKKAVEKVPFIHGWAIRIHSLFLDREDIKEGLRIILAAIEEVKKGYSIFIFPEGTRSRDGKFHEFKPGSFKIATKSGCPIIPVAISGTAEIFENHIPFVKPNKSVRLSFGKPIYPDKLSKEELKTISVDTHKIVEDMLSKHH